MSRNGCASWLQAAPWRGPIPQAGEAKGERAAAVLALNCPTACGSGRPAEGAGSTAWRAHSMGAAFPSAIQFHRELMRRTYPGFEMVGQGSDNLFCKRPIFLVFVGYMVSVTATQLHCCNSKAATAIHKPMCGFSQNFILKNRLLARCDPCTTICQPLLWAI